MARLYNGSLGQSPQRGPDSRGRAKAPPVVGAKPLKLKAESLLYTFI